MTDAEVIHVHGHLPSAPKGVALGCLLVLVFASPWIVGALVLLIPWALDMGQRHEVPGVRLTGIGVPIGLAMAGMTWYWTWRRRTRSAGFAVLGHGQVELYKPGWSETIRVDELRGYELPELESVQLRPQGVLTQRYGPCDPRLAIPTVDDKTRGLVMAWLDAAGVARLD